MRVIIIGPSGRRYAIVDATKTVVIIEDSFGSYAYRYKDLRDWYVVG